MTASKIAISIAELAALVQTARMAGKKIVHCHGVFDLLHPGHIRHLQAARELGDVLVVTVTPDRFVNKGPGRPVFGERLRSLSLAAIQVVDHVAVTEHPTAIEAIEMIRPDVYAKGSDYADPDDDLTGNISKETVAVLRNGGAVKLTDEESFSSSKLINRFLSPYPQETQSFLEDLRGRYSPRDVIDRLDAYRELKPLVLGEAIIDEYWYATPLAKAPREAIIAAKFRSMEKFAGGALATANHLAGFCNEVTLVASVGSDALSDTFIASHLSPNVNFIPIVMSDRSTVLKRRIIEPGHLTKMFEIQFLEDRDVSPETEVVAGKILDELVPEHDLTVVNDFGHGFLTAKIRAQLSSAHTFLSLNTQTNSANLGFNMITKYARADYCCIDEAEARLASGIQHGDRETCAAILTKKLNARWFMTTVGRDGAFLTVDHGPGSKLGVMHSPSLSPVVIDRVGAGDAFFALTAPWAYRGFPPDLAGFVGNCVGALKVGSVGNRTPVSRIALYKFITSLLK